MNPPGWILRPVVWFAAASMLTTILHEFTHACTAYALGVRSTLFNYSVDLDMTQAQAAGHERALIAIAGPLCCLAFGTVAWIAFRRTRDSAAALPLLYLSVFGVATFFGNAMSTAFAGDFSFVAIALRLPLPARYAISLIGALLVAAIHFRAGRELTRWIPVQIGRVLGALGVVALPVVLGTAAVILANSPMPSTAMAARIGEASFWIFAVIGVVVAPRPSRGGHERPLLRWADGAAILLAVLVVRLMVRGIPFVP